jgi:hypothetical protein
MNRFKLALFCTFVAVMVLLGVYGPEYNAAVAEVIDQIEQDAQQQKAQPKEGQQK